MALPTLQSFLPAWNASLNALAFLFLLLGLLAIKKRRQLAHEKFMKAAFATSSVFLASYLYYHFNFTSNKFLGQGLIRPIYFTMLISHIILAVVVLPFIFRILYLAQKGRVKEHSKMARF